MNAKRARGITLIIIALFAITTGVYVTGGFKILANRVAQYKSARLAAREQEKERAELIAKAERLRQIELAQQVEQTRINKIKEASKISNQVIGKYKADAHNSFRPETYELTLTDTSISIDHWSGRGPITLWFGEIKSAKFYDTSAGKMIQFQTGDFYHEGFYCGFENNNVLNTFTDAYAKAVDAWKQRFPEAVPKDAEPVGFFKLPTSDPLTQSPSSVATPVPNATGNPVETSSPSSVGTVTSNANGNPPQPVAVTILDPQSLINDCMKLMGNPQTGEVKSVEVKTDVFKEKYQGRRFKYTGKVDAIKKAEGRVVFKGAGNWPTNWHVEAPPPEGNPDWLGSVKKGQTITMEGEMADLLLPPADAPILLGRVGPSRIIILKKTAVVDK